MKISFWEKKRVLITGHTGFKGSWLTRWLLDLGAEVTGLALPPETTPNLFKILGLEKNIHHNEVDIRDANAINQVFAKSKPEIVFHLAAQPLVRLSYREPKATWDINVGGTVNLLEAIRYQDCVRVCVVITSDKCYENREQMWGYRETDAMGGHDPYSSSKGAAELAVASWRRSFFDGPNNCKLATARAGNVIGGGDWSADRIVVDFVNSIVAGQPLTLRNPQGTRPWQHVIEPLSGYLTLASRLFSDDGCRFTDGWNFGPNDDSIQTVENLAHHLITSWGCGKVEIMHQNGQPHEANLLKLDCSKARNQLDWRGVWSVPVAVRHTVDWYRAFYEGRSDIDQVTTGQINTYMTDATALDLSWVSRI